jgi:FdrA protein
VTACVVRIRPDTYVDSVLLMSATRAMLACAGVGWATAVMATPANVEALVQEGFDKADLDAAGANDLTFAVRAESTGEAETALTAGAAALEDAAGRLERAPGDRRPASLTQALSVLSGANLATISVPGPFAALEAHKAIGAGLNVLLFSDNVSVADEVDLKAHAAERGVLVMGPGAGTAMLGGIGLGFANVVRHATSHAIPHAGGSGRGVGIVAAAGTGAQEAMALLDRAGAEVSHIVGVGGRDLSEAVGGATARPAIAALEADPHTAAILLVSKPPAPAVAASVLGRQAAKPMVAVLVGLGTDVPVGEGIRLARTIDEGVMLTAASLGLPATGHPSGLVEAAEVAGGRLGPGRSAVRGLFSGGTLCSESMAVLARRLGAVYSNVPLQAAWALPAPAGAHRCLDLGEEEYTRGRPHPMIDPSSRPELILEEAADPATAVILLDVVLGYGSHPDPAGAIAPACREVASMPDGPVVVAYVLGTEADPQGYEAQRGRLAEAGCVLAPTGARAALLAAAIAARRPGMAAERP